MHRATNPLSIDHNKLSAINLYSSIPRLLSPFYPQSNHDDGLDDYTRFLKWIECTLVEERPHWMKRVEVDIGIVMNIPLECARKRGAGFGG